MTEPSNPQEATPAFAICAGTGALGIASGFALFFLFVEESERPLWFLQILLLATVLSLIVENLRETIEPHNSEHSGSAWSGALISLLVVGMSELFVMSWHALANLYGTEVFDSVSQIVMGGTFSSVHASYKELLMLVGLWMASGIAMAAMLSTGINRSEKPMPDRIRESAGVGVVAGIAVAPAVLLIYLAGMYLLRGGYLLLFKPMMWRDNFLTLQHSFDGVNGWPILIIRGVFWVAGNGLYLLGENNPRAPLLVVGAMLVISIVGIRNKWGWLIWFVLFIAIALVITPLVPAIGGLFLLILRTALLWILPGVLLGGLVPLLERPAESRKVWSATAFTAAVILVLFTFARLEGRWWLLIPAAGIVVTGYFVWRTGRIKACWPVLAVCVGTIICGSMLVLQQLVSFSGVLVGLYDIKNLPDRIAAIQEPAGKKNLPPGESLAAFAALNSGLLNRLKSFDDPAQNAQDLARARQEIQTLKDVSVKASAIQQGRDWLGELHRLQEEFAKFDNQPFHHRLKSVLEIQERLSNFEKDARKELKVTNAAVETVRTIQAPYRTGFIEKLAESNVERLGLSEAEQTQVEVWRTAIALRQQLDPYENTLEKLLGDPDRHAEGELIKFKRTFASAATDIYVTVNQWLELGLAGSFGFWTTLGLLASWSLFERRDGRGEAPGKSPG